MTRPTVLIVEDEREIADLVQFHLQRAGLDASIAHRGKAALEFIRKTPPDVVVLDLMLPDLDGLEICRRIRASDEHRRIGVIMVTAKGDEADVVAGIELGADDYLSKPVQPAALERALRRWLRPSVEVKT